MARDDNKPYKLEIRINSSRFCIISPNVPYLAVLLIQCAFIIAKSHNFLRLLSNIHTCFPSTAFPPSTPERNLSTTRRSSSANILADYSAHDDLATTSGDVLAMADEFEPINSEAHEIFGGMRSHVYHRFSHNCSRCGHSQLGTRGMLGNQWLMTAHDVT